MLAPPGPLNETDLHVEVRGNLLIVTVAATQFYAIYAKSTLCLAVTSFSDALGKQ